jgi:hypothetical protein
MLMIRKIEASLHRKWPVRWTYILALLGAAIYLVQAFIYAHTTTSRLDEGDYLYKGILFATGQYHPFELYGVWMDKAPLAFLIPGYAELIFGPGLRTGRYLAIFFGCLTLLGVWVASLRISHNKWLAVAAVWILVLSPVVIFTYSEGISQATIACLLAWTLALALGEKRSIWELTLSGFLAGMTIMTRQNMIPVLPLLVAYIFWQHGWKPAIFSLLAGGGLLIFFHILYWPYIMQLWLIWLPKSLQSFFADLQIPGVGLTLNDLPWESRLLSFFGAFRSDFLVLTGSLIALLLWPKTRAWKTQTDFRTAIFLEALFLILTFMHLWASLILNYCVFCFDSYIAFFNVSGILLLVVVINNLDKNVHPFRQVLLALCVVVIIAGIGYSAFERIGNWSLGIAFPFLHKGKVVFLSMWTILSNKFLLKQNAALKIASISAGALVGLTLLVVAFLIFKLLRRKDLNYAYVLAMTILMLGFVLSPFLAAFNPVCSTDVIAANEQVGAYLARTIPAGSLVYWNGGGSIAPLIYLPHIKIFPVQIDGLSTFLISGDSQQLLKYGYYNAQLDQQWLSEADIIIVDAGDYMNMKNKLSPDIYNELPSAPIPTSCHAGSQLRIFQRK